MMKKKDLIHVISFDLLKSVYKSKNYNFYDRGIYNVNIAGIRCNTSTNEFDDLLLVAYLDNRRNSVILQFAITTDPGEYWLKHPINKKGTAILVPGQYSGCYMIGLHHNKYKALVQAKSVKVYRDNNKDIIHDTDSSTIDKGFFGINIHHSNPYNESYYINKWSAGCQVFKRIDDFNEFMRIIEKSRSYYNNSFTYTLFDINDFD